MIGQQRRIVAINIKADRNADVLLDDGSTLVGLTAVEASLEAESLGRFEIKGVLYTSKGDKP